MLNYLNENHFEISEMDHYKLRGVDIAELARRYGTPLFVFDEKQLCENYRHFYQAFSRYYPKLIVCYSIKTNYNLAICKVLQQEGAHAEIASGLDLYVARRAGFPPERIIYDGLYKSEKELHEAMSEGVLLINAESLSEIELIDKIAEKLGIKQPIGLRINMFKPPKNPIRKILGEAFCYPETRFGFSLEETHEICRRALKMKNLQIQGLMTHPFHGAVKPLIALAIRLLREFGIQVLYLNLGGGFHVPTIQTIGLLDVIKDNLKRKIGLRSSLDRKVVAQNIDEVAKPIIDSVKCELEKYSLPEPVLVFEPGRYIVGGAGILLLRVTNIKETTNYKWIITDGGTNIFVGYGERHRILVANRASAALYEEVNVMGPLLYATDFITIKQRLPKLQVGDILAVLDVGAYNLSQSNQFLYPRPCAVLIRRGGHITVIRKRETYADVLQLNEELI